MLIKSRQYKLYPRQTSDSRRLFVRVYANRPSLYAQTVRGNWRKMLSRNSLSPVTGYDENSLSTHWITRERRAHTALTKHQSVGEAWNSENAQLGQRRCLSDSRGIRRCAYRGSKAFIGFCIIFFVQFPFLGKFRQDMFGSLGEVCHC